MFAASEVQIPGLPEGVPQVVNVTYDCWALHVTLLFERHPTRPFYVTFNSVGFRVLDEGQLVHYWEEPDRPKGCIWRVLSGGWFEQESARPGFLLGAHHEAGDPRPNEFLVVGGDACVSVLSWGEPHVRQAEP